MPFAPRRPPFLGLGYGNLADNAVGTAARLPREAAS